jgi:hypothetical protein
MGGTELTIELIEQLRAALAVATRIGDETAVYFVERALHACTARWGNQDSQNPPETPG